MFSSKLAIWKVSHGKNDFTNEERDHYLNAQLAVVHGETAKGQGLAFSGEMEVGDLIYLCHGNDAGIKVLAEIMSGATDCPKGDGWLQRKYRVIRDSSKPEEKYAGVRKGWAPNYNSTCKPVPDGELELFEQDILKPYFGVTLDECGNGGEDGDEELPLNLILYGPPGTGKTWQLSEWAKEFDEDECVFVTFHQSYSYEDFVEGIKPKMGAVKGQLEYEIKKGVFREIVDRAKENPEVPYALFIDEISRGNVASIFGELIALIEEDKRAGAKHELKMTLPYSREEFSVPANLHIIGAMNTADRSVEALDAALRRRFAFVEMAPDISKVELADDLDVDLRQLLATINGRIERLLDKDHCIGHSYFMGVAEAEEPLEELRSVFATKVLPLLEEHFYGDPAKIGMVLGPRFVKPRETAVELAKGNWTIDEFEEHTLWEVVDPHTLTDEDFASVYEPHA